MGAKGSKQSDWKSSKTNGRAKKMRVSRERSSSMPDKLNEADHMVSMSPAGTANGRTAALPKRSSVDHAPVDRTLTPPPDYSLTPEEVKSIYAKTTEKMVVIWPSYQYLKNIDLNDVDLEIVERITQVFRHLLDQRELIQTLSADNRHLNGLLRQIKDEGKPRGRNNRSGDNSGDRRFSEDPPVVSKSSTIPGHWQSELMKKDPTLDPKVKLMAEVQKMRDQALSSSTKRKSHDGSGYIEGPGSPGRLRRIPDTDKHIEILVTKITSLEAELAKSRMTPSSSSRGGQNASSEEIRKQILDRARTEYARLEKYMMNEAKAELDRVCKKIEDRTKYTLLCAVIKESYSVCESFRDTVGSRLKKLLLSPTNTNDTVDDTVSPVGREAPVPSTRTSVLESVSMFESAGQAASAPQANPKSTDARKHRKDTAVPDKLLGDFMTFMASTSEHVDTKPIIKDVTEHLKILYPDILTDTFLNNHIYKKFQGDCCKLAWCMCTADPPIKLHAADSRDKFHDQRHVPFRSPKILDAYVDYYLWPVLYDGDLDNVLAKGRVALKK